MAVGQIADLAERSHVSVHREHSVRDDQAKTRLCAFLQLALQIPHVAVGVAEAPRFAQPDAVDDAGVIERVGNHRIVVIEEHLEDSAVGVEA